MDSYCTDFSENINSLWLLYFYILYKSQRDFIGFGSSDLNSDWSNQNNSSIRFLDLISSKRSSNRPRIRSILSSKESQP